MLALAWAAVFLPAVLRARETAPYSSTERFRRRMDLIAPKSGRYLIAPKVTGEPSRAAGRIAERKRRMRRRRLRIFVLLLACVPASAVAALIEGGGAWWEVHLGVDAVFALYVVYLIEARKRSHEREVKVRRLNRGADYRVPRDELIELHEPAGGI